MLKKLYTEYFNRKISQDDLYRSLGIGETGFERLLLDELLKFYEQQDTEMIEYLIFTLYFGEESINLSSFLEILNKLIICEWHNQHEDIATLLQKIGSPESIDYLYKAIFLKPEYLVWDDNYAFEKKCVHAIAKCKNPYAKERLQALAFHENEIIKTIAERQLQKFK